MAENATANTPTDSDDSSLEVYVWAGGLIAGLGVLFTPAVTGVPALYCALKLKDEKPLSAIGIGLVISFTVVFWSGFLFGRELIATIAQTPVLIAVSGVGLLVLISVLFAVLYLFVLAGGTEPLEDK